MKTFVIIFVFLLVLSGCGSPDKKTETPQTKPSIMEISKLKGGLIKSEDGGVSFVSSVAVSDKKNLSGVSILSLKQSLVEPNTWYAGSVENGLFVTRDSGSRWEHVDTFPGAKVYALTVHPTETAILYVTAVEGKRGKIFKTEDAMKTWKEVYTEPADGTVVLSLAMDPSISDTLFAATSKGVVLKTHDAGKTWENVQKLSGAVSSIIVDSAHRDTVYFLLFEGNLAVSRDSGKTVVVQTSSSLPTNLPTTLGTTTQQSGISQQDNKIPVKIYSITQDRYGGTLVVGADDGVYRVSNFAQRWERLNVIGSSAQYPARAVAVSPHNSNEIVYAVARAIYRTVDGGATWSVTRLEANAGASAISFDRVNPSMLFVGLRT